MDYQKFDALTKTFGSGLSRRSALRALVGLLGGGAAMSNETGRAAPEPRVKICHHTGSAGNPIVRIMVDQSSVEMHLAHGDWLVDAQTQCCSDGDCASNGRCQQGMCCKAACADDECGQVGDSCGNLITCDRSCCQPRTACEPYECGTVDDGCEGVLICERACCEAKLECGEHECGFVDDGCGGELECPRLCGVSEPCDHPDDCIPLCSCNGLQCCRDECDPSECGYIDDGCGDRLWCGVYCGSEENGGNGGGCDDEDDCAPGYQCDDSGRCCLAGCPEDACGFIPNGCGATLDCGRLCGGGGQCDADSDCAPGLTCTEDSICCKTACRDDECGYVNNACGAEIECGRPCGGGDSCDSDLDCTGDLTCTDDGFCCRGGCPEGACGVLSNLCGSTVTCGDPCGVGDPCTEPGQCGSGILCTGGHCCMPGCPEDACGWRNDPCADAQINCGPCGLGGSCRTDDDCDVTAGLGCISDAGNGELHCCRTFCLPDDGECGFIDDGHQMGNLVTCVNKCEGGQACVTNDYCRDGFSCINGTCCQTECLADDCGTVGDSCNGTLQCGSCADTICSHYSDCGDDPSHFPCCSNDQGQRVCVDAHTDPENCGSCGNACDEGKVCCHGFCCSPEACCPHVGTTGVACLNSCAASGGRCADDAGTLICACPGDMNVPSNQTCGTQCAAGNHCPDGYECLAGNCCLAECPANFCGLLPNGCGTNLECPCDCDPEPTCDANEILNPATCTCVCDLTTTCPEPSIFDPAACRCVCGPGARVCVTGCIPGVSCCEDVCPVDPDGPGCSGTPCTYDTACCSGLACVGGKCQ